MVIARLGRNAKAVPGGYAVLSDLALHNVLFQPLKSRAQSRVKLVARNKTELRFRIVNVIDIDGGKIHVPERLVQLALQIPWCHAVAAAHDIFKLCNAGPDKSFFDITADVTGWPTVKRQIAALGADNHFVARKARISG